MSLSQPAHADRTNPALDSVRIALLGCGTVGSGVAHLLLNSHASIASRGGIPYVLEAIAVRSQDKVRPLEIPHALIREDAQRIVLDPAIDLVVECIGGTTVAAELVELALSLGKHVVTANKDLLATRGPQLRRLAARHGTSIAYEAAVGGAIPIVRTIAESLAGEEILEVGGVLNGTTNFILSQMEQGATYDAALADAQRLGFAEADPTNDVAGIDAAHKLAILAQLAFRRALTTSAIPRTGITGVAKDDLALARRLGMTVKLIASARKHSAIVTPAYVDRSHPFAQVTGPQNCIRVIGRSSGSLTFAGTGAGSGPTASAVIGDIVAVLRKVAAARAQSAVHTSDELELTPATTAHDPATSLPHIVRLLSFRDTRPAQLALAAAGASVTTLDGVPALRVAPQAEIDLRATLEASGIVPESVLPLWDDHRPENDVGKT